jgi:hypothetical protein
MWLCYSQHASLHGAPEQEPALHGVCFGKLLRCHTLRLTCSQAGTSAFGNHGGFGACAAVHHAHRRTSVPLTVRDDEATASRVVDHLVATGLTHDQAWGASSTCVSMAPSGPSPHSYATNLLASDIFSHGLDDALELR